MLDYKLKRGFHVNGLKGGFGYTKKKSELFKKVIY